MGTTPQLEPRLLLRSGKGFLLRLGASSFNTDLLWAALVGCGGALAAYLFRLATRGIHWLLTLHSGNLTQTAKDLHDFAPLAILIVPVLGGLLAGLVLYVGMHLTRRQSAKDYMEAIRIGDGFIRVRTTLVKSLSSLITIASGGSIGREGPLVQLASMVGSFPGRLLNMTVERRRLLVACGTAAGIASAYNAPIAGALFVAEIVLGTIAMDNFGPLLFASVTATVVTRNLLFENPIFEIPLPPPAPYTELFAHLFTGILAGVAAPLFLGLLKSAERLFGKLPWPAYAKLALGGLIVGLISLQQPLVWGNGYSVVNDILHHPWLPSALLAMLVWKLLATSSSVGSGAVGGVFTPTLFVGAVLGALVAALVHWIFPGYPVSNTFIVVGMGAFLAATTHAPVMATIMLFEMTLDYRVLMPLCVACVFAYYVSSALNPDSIYADSLRTKAKRGEE